MTTHEFEFAAKVSIADWIEDECGMKFLPGQIQAVWVCHILGNKKGLFIDPDRHSNRYYEVTYAAMGEMYLDVYEKKEAVKLRAEEVAALRKNRMER